MFLLLLLLNSEAHQYNKILTVFVCVCVSVHDGSVRESGMGLTIV